MPSMHMLGPRGVGRADNPFSSLFSIITHDLTRPPARLETVPHSFIGLAHYFTADSGLKRLERRLERREERPPPMFFPIET